MTTYILHVVAMGDIPQHPVTVTTDNLEWWINLNISAHERVVRIDCVTTPAEEL